MFVIPAGERLAGGRLAGYEPLPAATPETWLLRVGWERHGPISAYDVPRRL